MSTLASKMKQFGSNVEGVTAATKFLSRLQKITSQSQLISFLHTAGSTIGKFQRSGAAIHVQPGSIQRRRPGLTRGCKRLPAGRRSKDFQPVFKKRRHNLATNAANNLLNGQ